MPADLALISEIRAALVAAGDPEKAAAQQAYMKSELPYHGVPSPDLKRLLRPILALYEPESRDAHEATVRTLWDEVTHREEWYAAIALARHRRARQWLDPASVPLWRHLLVTGAWWDVVDEIASHLVGETLAGHRAEVTPVMRAWATDEDPWLRRTSLICQLTFRGRDGPRPVAPRDRQQYRRPVVLAAQGHRVGAASARQDRPRLGARRGGPARRPDVRVVEAGGDQASALVQNQRIHIRPG